MGAPNLQWHSIVHGGWLEKIDKRSWGLGRTYLSQRCVRRNSLSTPRVSSALPHGACEEGCVYFRLISVRKPSRLKDSPRGRHTVRPDTSVAVSSYKLCVSEGCFRRGLTFSGKTKSQPDTRALHPFLFLRLGGMRHFPRNNGAHRRTATAVRRAVSGCAVIRPHGSIGGAPLSQRHSRRAVLPVRRFRGPPCITAPPSSPLPSSCKVAISPLSPGDAQCRHCSARRRCLSASAPVLLFCCSDVASLLCCVASRFLFGFSSTSSATSTRCCG